MAVMTFAAIAMSANAQKELPTRSVYDVDNSGSVNVTDVTKVVNRAKVEYANDQQVVTANDLKVVLDAISKRLDDVEKCLEGIKLLNQRLNAVESVSGIEVENGHEYVDLDLPSGTLWATCNVGALIPEDYGDYYAWGETEKKETYWWGNYKWTEEETLNGAYVNKYSSTGEWGKDGWKDGLEELEAADDVAHVKWGGKWRMPSYTQMLELLNKCNWKMDTKNGIVGFTFASKVDPSKSIFLPAAGNSQSTHYIGEEGYYWTSTSKEVYYSCDANNLRLRENKEKSTDNKARCLGLSVRPVFIK